MSHSHNANDELMERKVDVNDLVGDLSLFHIFRWGALINGSFVNMERISFAQ